MANIKTLKLQLLFILAGNGQSKCIFQNAVPLGTSSLPETDICFYHSAKYRLVKNFVKVT